jgi:hypothetical protein
MKEQSYRVVLNGAVADGFDRDGVIEKLAGAFKKDKRVIEKLMAAAPKSLRGGLDLATARKYQAILEKMGAASRIEAEEVLPIAAAPEKGADKAPETPSAAVPEPDHSPVVETSELRRLKKRHKPTVGAPRDEHTPPSLATACPKCGYQPTSSHDVLLVRGDCPRCGLRVRKDLVIEAEDSQEAEYRLRMARPEMIYQDRIPASWERKSAASLHTLGLFLAVHAGLVLLWIFLFVPVAALPTHAGTLFLEAALLDWPGLLVSAAIVLVSFVLPLFNRGLSWGQRIADIEVLYTEETKMGGFYLSLALRTATAISISLVPGWLTMWIGSWFGWFPQTWTAATVTIVCGIVAWVASWLYACSRADKRSLADLAAGTVQVEETPMRRDAFGKAWLLIFAVTGCWLLLAGVIPLVMALVRRWWP